MGLSLAFCTKKVGVYIGVWIWCDLVDTTSHALSAARCVVGVQLPIPILRERKRDLLHRVGVNPLSWSWTWDCSNLVQACLVCFDNRNDWLLLDRVMDANLSIRPCWLGKELSWAAEGDGGTHPLCPWLCWIIFNNMVKKECGLPCW